MKPLLVVAIQIRSPLLVLFLCFVPPSFFSLLHSFILSIRSCIEEETTKKRTLLLAFFVFFFLVPCHCYTPLFVAVRYVRVAVRTFGSLLIFCVCFLLFFLFSSRICDLYHTLKISAEDKLLTSLLRNVRTLHSHTLYIT